MREPSMVSASGIPLAGNG